MAQTMLFEVLRGILVGVHSTEAPSDSDWDAWNAFAVANAKDYRAILVFTDGAGPNGVQRAKTAKVQELMPLPTAIVTASALARGIVTALAWMGKNIRAFSPEQVHEAFGYLSVPAATQADLMRDVASLRVRIAGGSLDMVLGQGQDAAEIERLMSSVVAERIAKIRARLNGGR